MQDLRNSNYRRRMPHTRLVDLPQCPWSGTATSLSRGLRLPPDLGSRPTCAVVGSADTLRLAPQGQAIDAHKLVWRLNNAPTSGFEQQVGRRTSVRVLNHVAVEKWVMRARNRSKLLATTDGDEYDRLLCAPGETEFGCVLSRANAADRTASFEKKLQVFRQLYPKHTLTTASPELQSHGRTCNHQLRGTQPSGGLVAVLLALAVCAQPLDLYGFWPHCCRPRAGWPAMNYKYSQGNRTRFVCCSQHREKFEVEYGWYQRLQRLGVARVHSTPPGRGGGGGGGGGGTSDGGGGGEVEGGGGGACRPTRRTGLGVGAAAVGRPLQ